MASFNVLHGRDPMGGPADLDRLVSACASLDADVLGLQEIDRSQRRSADVDQTAAVADGSGAEAWRFQAALVGEPGGHWRAAGAGDDDVLPADGYLGAYGVGLVSRWPVLAWHVLRLSAAPLRSPVYVPGRRAFILLPDEPRVVLAAEIDHPDGLLVVATTHLSFVPGWNVVQLRRATRFLAGLGPRCVLLGDFNLPGPVPRLVTGREWRPLARIATFPADRPSLQLDHALASGPVPDPVGVSARQLDLSDHRALVVDLPSGPPSPKGVTGDGPRPPAAG